MMLKKIAMTFFILVVVTNACTGATIQPGTMTEATVPARSDATPLIAVSESQTHALPGRLPLQFEANEGQVDLQVKFLSRRRGLSIYLMPTQVALIAAGTHSTSVLALQLIDADPAPALTGEDKLPGVVNYYVGGDPARWRTGISTYAKVRYHQVYPGVDMVFYGNGQEIEHDFVLEPGADPDLIRMDVRGADSLQVTSEGDLVLHAGGEALRLLKPFIYQEIAGQRQEIAGGYVLQGPQRFGFKVASYDRDLPLVIDPTLAYSTHFGGSGNDYGDGITVDASGNTYVAGATNSTDFPTLNAFQPAFGGGGVSCPTDLPTRVCYDVFVTKINAAGTAVLYSTYLGYPGDDEGRAIAVDTQGNAYVTGRISLAGAPPLEELYIYPYVFAAKFSPTGSLNYGLVFGESSGSIGLGIAVDATGRAYVTGEVSGNIPTTANAIQPERGEIIDAFVLVVSAAGDTLEYGSYLGGNAEYCKVCYSVGNGIAVDDQGMIYVTGQAAPSFPTTPNAFKSSFAGTWKAFVTKIDPSKSGAAGLIYSTYLGGTGNEFGKAIALDAARRVYVTGSTQSDDFDTTPGAYDRACGTDGICNTTSNMVCDPVPPGLPPVCHLDAKADIFVVKLDLTKSGAASLLMATYIGGSGKEWGSGIAVDATGGIYVAGMTVSPDFPVVQPLQATHGGNFDAIVLKLNAAGSALDFATYMGGGGDEEGKSLALDSAGNAYITGYTGSAAFPVVNPLRARSGGWEAFIAKIKFADTNVGIRTFLPLVLRHGG